MEAFFNLIVSIIKFFFNKKKDLPLNNKPNTPIINNNSNPIGVIMPQNKIYITASMYWMGRDKLYAAEWVNTIQENAKVLLRRVNDLLNEIQLCEQYQVSSGWRPAAINAKITNAAKRSNHMRGLAIDIADIDQKLSSYLLKHLYLLEKYGLWMEDPKSTKTWTHLQSVAPASNHRVFIP